MATKMLPKTLTTTGFGMHSIAAGLMVLPDRKVHKVPQGQMVHRGRQVLLELPGRKVLLARRGLRVLKVLQVQMAQLDHKAQPAYKVQLDQQG
jgi:hypothetical protein